MKFTNRKGLPDIIVRAVTNDPYNAGKKTDYSATTLIRPAYQVMLQREHADEIVEDVADRLWSMYGSAVHHIIERGEESEDLVEERFYATVADKVISAQIDHYGLTTRAISDWKLTGAYKVKKAIQEHDYEDWEQQLNIQAYLMQVNGYEVQKLFIGAMCRDWSKYDFEHEKGYPDQIEYIELPLWTMEEQESFIEQRIAAMSACKPCTRAERWQDLPTYALMKEGGKRALKVEKTREAMWEYAINKDPSIALWRLDGELWDAEGGDTGFRIIERIPKNRRCEGYCNVAKFCDYYKATYLSTEEMPFK